MSHIARFVFEVRFKPSPRMLDKRGEIAETIEKDLFDLWRIGSGRIEFANAKDSNIKAYISHKNFGLVSWSPYDKTSFLDKSLAFIDKAWDAIPTKQILRVGVRSHYAEQISSKPDAVISFKDQFLKPTQLVDSYGMLADFSFGLNFKDGDNKINSLFGPLSKEEAAEQFSDTTIMDFPEDSLFVDVDFYRDSFDPATKKSLIGEILSAGLEKSEKLRNDILKDIKL